jgi:hypothetical protein
MPPSGPGKTLRNERKYPHIVELAVDTNGLDVELSRRIMDFHKSRHIQPRHGRAIARQDGFYYRWCFADLPTATAFVEQFDGEFCKPSI